MDDASLHALALAAARNAYAPYSRYRVGAAVLAVGGKVYTGANVENASYGLTICAERAAIFRAANEGERRIVAVAVAIDGETPARPCGACRQVIREFGTDVRVVMGDGPGKFRVATIGELLPESFGPDFMSP